MERETVTAGKLMPITKKSTQKYTYREIDNTHSYRETGVCAHNRRL